MAPRAGELLRLIAPAPARDPWSLASDVTGLCVEHSELVCEEARPWMVEVEFPEMPLDERFMRFGTDLLPRMRASYFDLKKSKPMAL